MLSCSSPAKRVNLRLLCTLISVLIIECNGFNDPLLSADEYPCPSLETLSFGSDIMIRCNSTYFQFNPISNERFKWKFANQSSMCQAKEKTEALVNECGVNRIKWKFLTVRLVNAAQSPKHREYACAYCPINYKSIAPMIFVKKISAGPYQLYKFNLTAMGLDHGESFEILWAKRRSSSYDHSINYWFLQRCIAHEIKILKSDGHSIVFTADDFDISRVEFIIRRCHGTCRDYSKCDDEVFANEASGNTLHMPDSIEKVSCDQNCLKGILPPLTTTTTTTIMTSSRNEPPLSSAIQSSNEQPRIKYLILFSFLVFLIVLSFLIVACVILTRIRGLRTDNIYTKTGSINLDENKETVE